jgi:hypothetical protein
MLRWLEQMRAISTNGKMELALRRLQQLIEDSKRAFPVFRHGILKVRIDDLKCARECNAQPTGNRGKRVSVSSL